MKKIFLFLFSFQSFWFANAQADEWKEIMTPNLSSINILYQNQKGQVIANTHPFIGLAKSLDGCISWSIIDSTSQFYQVNSFTENNKGDIIFYRHPFIYRMDSSSGELHKIKEQKGSGFKQLITIGDDIIVGILNNAIYTFTKDSVIIRNFFNNNIVQQLLNANSLDKAYCIVKTESTDVLYQITNEGILSKIRDLNQSGKKYFFHNNTLISDIHHSTDLGQSWIQFDLPFSKPDIIFKYNNMLAFGNDDKIYYKPDNSNNFSVIELPNETNLANTLSGKYLISKNKDDFKIGTKILRQQNGSFEPVLYNIALPYVDYFAAGFDEQIIASYINNDVFFKKDSISSWRLLPIKTRIQRHAYSFSEDKYIDILDDQNNIYSSFDQGITWQKFQHPPIFYPSSFYCKKNATFLASPEILYYRRTNETKWNSKEILNIGGGEVVEISNQADLYKNYFGAEQLTHTDTFNNLRNIRDIVNFRYISASHYEMNTFYNIGRFYNLKNESNFAQLSSTYDQGFNFNILHNFPENFGYIGKLVATASGHLIVYLRNSLLISADEGRTWNEIFINLNSWDYILSISVSPDHYIYVSTKEKGILKYKFPLAKPNIVYVNLNEDKLSDCDSSNDEAPLFRQKISLKDLSSQYTDVRGEAVFYSHNIQNKLFVHNENNILDICQDTMLIDFSSNGGNIISEVFSAVSQNECSQLDVKVINYNTASINFSSRYHIQVRNSGNTRSSVTEIQISLDPYQDFDTTFNAPIFTKISDKIYSVQIPELDPFDEFTFQLLTSLVPYVPFDRDVCISLKLGDGNNLCRPIESIVKCNIVNRAGNNKTIALKFFEDKNGNCFKDPQEKYTIGEFYTSNNNRDITVEHDSIKYIITSLDTNNISFVFNDKLYSFCQESYPISIHKDSLYYEIDIPFRTLDYCTDIQLHGIHGALRPCFSRSLSYRLHNYGNIKSGHITVTITIDSELEVTAVSPIPLTINGSTYVFLFDSLNTTASQQIRFNVTVPCSAPIGESYCFQAFVSEEHNDLLCQLNNDFTSDNCIISRGSYDPNDKTIFISGIEDSPYIQKDDNIEYRIRFQNTGTDTAYTVRIEDKLSDKIEIKSIKLTDYSHACTWKIENSILIVTFNDINLVDSFTNSEGSNGFVTFELKLKENIQVNDEIRNKASIFFDFNDPIITNEVIKNFGTLVSVKDQNSRNIKKQRISFKPNPTLSNFKVLWSGCADISFIHFYSISGHLMKTICNHNIIDEIDISDLPKGAYIVKVKTELKSAVGSLIKL